jgi:drug/metabolite transporter (DMT)-like permease
MVASAAGFTIMTTLIKYLAADYPPALQAFYRQAAGVVVLLPWIMRDWRGSFHTTRFGVVLFRSLVGTVAMIMSFYAFQELPLADANALSFTRTLWMVPLAAFVLREPVGLPRISAAVIGFGGVLLMLASLAGGGFAPLGLPQLAALAAAFLFALTITGMKSLTRDHSTFTLLVWSAVLGLVFIIPPAMLDWRWPTPLDLTLLCVMGVIGVVTQACYIKGMQIGDAAAMAPIDYTRLVFATFAGFVLFAEVPGLLTLAGAAIVVGATLTITLREHFKARRDPQPPMS